MRVITIACLKDNYSYLLVDRDRSGALFGVVIDPSEAEPVEAVLEREGIKLGAIWLTHHHWDHVGGIEALCDRRPGIEVWGSVYDQTQARIPRQTHACSEGSAPGFGEHPVTVWEVPGHTLGAVAYQVGGCLFTGDTLFLAGCGRLFEGSAAQMQTSFAKLRALNPALLVYAGHEYAVGNLRFGHHVEPDNVAIASRLDRAQAMRERGEPTVPGRLSEELETNVFMRWDAAAVMQFASVGSEPAQVFGAVRKAKDGF